MWDMMIEKVKDAIHAKERNKEDEFSSFCKVVYKILIDRWNKNNTPLRCLAHSLNPRSYFDQWLHEDPKRGPSHKDLEVSNEKAKCFKTYFQNLEEHKKKIALEYARFIDSYSKGESKMWDIARDSFDTLEVVGLLEVANLSLHEPELEIVIFLVMMKYLMMVMLKQMKLGQVRHLNGCHQHFDIVYELFVINVMDSTYKVWVSDGENPKFSQVKNDHEDI
ncbi:hypothetical protein FEM48_Zijuj04G0129600 [Ziziphus jujuba var. spinosa]|uniref:Uncharacterized protein n=1 Tax=Ziziphus jujuba var. spinosa TaxID=714518 RepID=A0A978VK09_ZIZJJ|nr:hypothetical protein FEM48_Zijuj04G0129600 [Ziziphus jujuba var. spinosa]